MPYRKKHTPKVHIRTPQIHQPGRGWGWVLLVLIVAIVAVGGWKLYELGGKRAGFDRQKAVDRANQISAKMDGVVAERDELRQKIASSKLSSQVDKEAVNHLREELKDLQDENLAYREEMAFLEGLISNTAFVGALRIESFTLSAANAPGTFRYEVSLFLTPASDKETKMGLTLKAHGLQEGKKVEIALNKLDPEKRKSIALNFKNIEQFTGEIVIPEGFQPQELEVELSVKGGKIRGEKKMFPWKVSTG